MTARIAQRKQDHLALCASGEVGFREKSTLLEEVHFLHNALPEVHAAQVSLDGVLLGLPLRAPIVIAAMTGGTAEAKRVNLALAGVAEERGYAFGLGSQRAMLVSPELRDTFQVRSAAKTTLVLGNIGVVQARDLPSRTVAELAEAVGATALCVHLNPAMELVQPGGDRDFRCGADTIERLVNELAIPVVVKETGCGLSRAVATMLRARGVKHVDVSGSGGTSWVGVEAKRAADVGDVEASALGELLWDWGIPTAASILQVNGAGFETLIATGGITNGHDVARALGLGATAAGFARPVLQAFYAGGESAVHRFFDTVERQLLAIMILTGSQSPSGLRQAPKVIGPKLAAWADA
jgi:isopentenyl-diphosphate delta-isomerase